MTMANLSIGFSTTTNLSFISDSNDTSGDNSLVLILGVISAVFAFLCMLATTTLLHKYYKSSSKDESQNNPNSVKLEERSEHINYDYVDTDTNNTDNTDNTDNNYANIQVLSERTASSSNDDILPSNSSGIYSNVTDTSNYAIFTPKGNANGNSDYVGGEALEQMNEDTKQFIQDDLQPKH